MAGFVSIRLAVMKFPPVPAQRGFFAYIREFSRSCIPCSCIRSILEENMCTRTSFSLCRRWELTQLWTFPYTMNSCGWHTMAQSLANTLSQRFHISRLRRMFHSSIYSPKQVPYERQIVPKIRPYYMVSKWQSRALYLSHSLDAIF